MEIKHMGKILGRYGDDRCPNRVSSGIERRAGKKVGAHGGGGVLLYFEQAISRLTQLAGMIGARDDPV